MKESGEPGHKSPAERPGALEVTAAHSAAQWRQAKAALGQEHGLGAGREAGDRLCSVGERGRALGGGAGVVRGGLAFEGAG